jgi:hypothetical protein
MSLLISDPRHYHDADQHIAIQPPKLHAGFVKKSDFLIDSESRFEAKIRFLFVTQVRATYGEVMPRISNQRKGTFSFSERHSIITAIRT